ncbi:hypothetical protein B0T24DRAFT_80709 [Lasiosphaeria ovina]|uniref:Uncharacterized protein n=1 Tax=Lasiosphaeria ovina TaxID=92902 RepID=A0AAE0NMZ9_9PEZI|nr:hypothetical protein B0T24DRAFT_80709 [Lasiosphaeria ovina]
MEVLPAATPSPGPPSEIRTPPAPRHGYSDHYNPYTPRKSERKSLRIEQRIANRTPSPNFSSRHHSDHRFSLGSPKSHKPNPATMASPATSPRKRRVPALDSSRRASGTLAPDGSAHAATTLGLEVQNKSIQRGRAGASASHDMLITPAKTPQPPPTEKSKAKIKAVARNLFSDNEVMPTSKKTRTSKYVLDSFSVADDVDEPVQIYTDSHERIPEVDRSAENPFFGDHVPAAPEPARRRSKRQTVVIPGEGSVTVDEAVGRNDGILVSFRGKKQFRKFARGDESDQAEGGLESVVERSKPLSAHSITPRLLFPTSKADKHSEMYLEDEEADTDIEDHVLAGMENDPATPMELVNEAPGTPEAPRFAPASPPTTARTTRFGAKKSAETTPMKPKSSGHGKRGAFDSWRRVKGGSDGQSSKRAGDALPGAATKRTRA